MRHEADNASGGASTPEQREVALLDALRGVELGDNDARIVAWMLSIFDERVIVSLLLRCRQAGMVDVLALEEHPSGRAASPRSAGEAGRVDPLVDAALEFGLHTAEAAAAGARGDQAEAVAANRKALRAFGRLLDVAGDRPASRRAGSGGPAADIPGGRRPG